MGPGIGLPRTTGFAGPSYLVDHPFIDHPFIDHPFIDYPFIDHPFIDYPFIDLPGGVYKVAMYTQRLTHPSTPPIVDLSVYLASPCAALWPLAL